jgi:hypothetical protein
MMHDCLIVDDCVVGVAAYPSFVYSDYLHYEYYYDLQGQHLCMCFTYQVLFHTLYRNRYTLHFVPLCRITIGYFACLSWNVPAVFP